MSGAREPIMKAGDVVEGRYRILKTLGEGGMGTVFLAEHALIKRRVALKLLHPELAADAEVVERFMNEARAAGTLGHPNIVESTDMGFTPERVPYIVFEFLEGALLTDEIYRVGGFTVRRAVRIAQQIASALHAAHVANIIHRDLKSDNVFLTDKDEALDHVKVLDFGISRFLEIEDHRTLRGVVMGTPEFMSPEQITAPDQVDRRTDVYALGVILYEMLTARRPFSSDDDPRALLTRIVNTPAPPLGREDVPHALGELILNKMLAKDPADRYPTMMDVEAALASYTTRAESGGLRRGRTTTQPVIAAAGAPLATPPSTGEVPILRRPTIPRPASTTVPPWHQGRPDTDDHIAAAAVAQAPIHKKPWLLYSVAGVGVLVGAAGLVIGTRGGESRAARPPIVIVPPAPVPAAVVVTPPARTVGKVDVRVEADAAGARVTFRRRVIDAPATFQINASDIVELVEIAAPGYKTERYWLTLDRPTHLNARMTRGDGLAEATEEETLIALGELAAPAEAPTVAAADAPAVAGVSASGAAGEAPPRATGESPAVAAGAVPSVAAGAVPAVATDVSAPGTPSSEAAAGDASLVAAAAPVRRPVRPPARRKIGRAAAVAAKPVVAVVEPDPVVAAPASLDGDPAPQAGTPPAAGGAPELGFAGAAVAPASDPTKPDGVKADGAKADGAKVDGAKADAKVDAKLDAAKADGAKPDGAKVDAKLDAAKADGAKADGAKADGAKADGAKADGAKADSAKPDGAKAGSGKADAPKADGAKAGSGKADGAKPGEAARAAEPDAAAAKALFAAHRLDVDRCFTEGRATNKTLAGTIRLELLVGLDGRVKRVQPHATFDAPAVIECIVAAAIRWTFPERTTGDVITIISPFTLQ